jgi:TonB family protein
MQKTSLVLAFALAAGFAVAQIPDAQGVTVELNGAVLLHRTSVSYPEAARTKSIKGGVTAEVTLDASGNVTDARILSGPEELRKPVLQSVLGWHFAGGTAGAQRQVTVTFNPPSGTVEADRLRTTAYIEERRAKAMQLAREQEATRPAKTVQGIQVLGLPDAQRDELLSRIPLRAGDVLTVDSLQKATQAVLAFDEHMTVNTARGDNENSYRIQIGTADARSAAMRTEVSANGTPGRIKVGGNVQQARLVMQPKPVYPPAAKEARIQGVVKLDAVIGLDGTVRQLEVISGHPLLVPAALDAVKQWVYQQTLLNDNPVEVATQIDINFTLSQ